MTKRFVDFDELSPWDICFTKGYRVIVKDRGSHYLISTYKHEFLVSETEVTRPDVNITIDRIASILHNKGANLKGYYEEVL